MSILVALLIFSFIVFIHELGHFLFARRAGIAVEEFAIGMGPKIFGIRRNGMDWTIRILPIGGFCKMYGEDGPGDDDDKSKKENVEERVVERPEDLNGDAFFEKSVWDRILTVFGGPLFNFILAFVFASLLVLLGGGSSTVVDYTLDDFPAQAAGIESGDKIISIDGHRLLSSNESRIYVNMANGEALDVVIERDGEKISYMITPSYVEADESLPPEESTNIYYIGVVYSNVTTSFINVVKYGFLETLSWIKIVFYSLGLLFTGQVSFAQISGPVGIVGEISTTYEASLAYGIKEVVSNIAFFVVLLSANLGVMNLLPIPALDGGRLVFLFIEAVRGKPLAPSKEGFIHFIGFVLLMLLMAVVMINDFMR